MGRRGRGGRGGKGRDAAASGPPKRTPADHDRFGDVPATNEKFEAYYKAQNILPEDEWQAFMDKLHDPLPTTFRLTGSRPIAPALNEMIRRVFVPFLSGIVHEGVALSPPRTLDWYPKSYAWQLDLSKQQIRKNDAFKKFQHFLVSETDAGNISRQEAVSMLPPLLLEVEPHHFVLDLCAAPGSKSAQLLEAIHTPLPTTSPSASLPAGLLIANDSDAKRCHLLVHQSLHRIPAAEMMVTNHDASLLPGLRLPDTGGSKKWKALLFDRILADVPCSGDGTLRKNLGIWREWNVGNGMGLHPLQLRILLRGIALLKPGGRLVYSTCSMNPMENEAVVSAALEACPDMSILPVPHLLPKLRRRPGLTTWAVYDSNLSAAPITPEQGAGAEEEAKKKGSKKTWTKTLWPNGKEAERGMNACWRLYPHLNDTGAFFVAVLVKKEALVQPKEDVKMDAKPSSAEIEVKPEASTSSEPLKRTASARGSSPVADEPDAKRVKPEVNEDSEEVLDPVAPKEDDASLPVVDLSTLPPEIVGLPAVKVKGPSDFKEEPYIYLSPDDDQVKLCLEFFDLSSSFPISSLLVRNATGHALRTLYFTSPLVRTLLASNSYTRMRLISCGTKLFVKQGQDGTGHEGAVYRCKWRIASEGLEVVRPFMGPNRLCRCGVGMLKLLMKDMSVTFETILEHDKEFLERLQGMEMGSCVLEVKAFGEDVSTEQDLVLPFWRSRNSVNLMVEKLEKSALSNRLWGEDITPHAPGLSKRDKKRAEEETKVAVEEEGAPAALDGKSEGVAEVEAGVAEAPVEPE